MKKPHLAVLLYSLAGGGAERVTSVLLPFLMEHFEVELVLLENTIAYSVPALPIHILGRNRANENGLLKLLKIPLIDLKYDLFLRQRKSALSLSLMNRPNYINVLAHRFFGAPSQCIISERAMPSLQYGYGDLTSRINRFLITMLYPMAHHIIANSQGNANDLIKNFAINANRLSVIANPFNVEKISKYAKVPKESHGIIHCITLGRLDRGKNHRLLIETIACLSNPSLHLTILGEGELRRELTDLIDELGMSTQITLLGFDPNPYAILARSDIFLFSSNHEGFPNVLVEALACGLPVISTDCPSGPREILAPSSDIAHLRTQGWEEGEYGILVAPNDCSGFCGALRALIENKTLRERYALKAPERANAFQSQTIAQQFIDTLQNLM